MQMLSPQIARWSISNTNHRVNMLNFFFICQHGGLELKGRILAASLRHFAKPPFNIVACVPTNSTIGEPTIAMFESLGVEIFPFEPEIWKAFDYPIGNKVDAAVALTRSRDSYCAFLDTDTLAIKQFEPQRLAAGDIGAAAIFGPQVFIPQAATMLNEFIATLTPPMNEEIAPFESTIDWRSDAFNAGVIVFRSPAWAEKWRSLVLQVLASDLPLRFRHPFADQVALALMKRHREASFQVLPRRWNCGADTINDKTIIYHYHALLRAFDNDLALRTIKLLDKTYSSTSQSLLGEITAKDLYRGKRRVPVAPQSER